MSVLVSLLVAVALLLLLLRAFSGIICRGLFNAAIISFLETVIDA
jgi:hypothetical protein